MWIVTLKTPRVRKRPPMTTRSSSLRYVPAAEHHTAEQYSKTGRTKRRKHFLRSNLSWNTCRLPQETKPLRSCSTYFGGSLITRTLALGQSPWAESHMHHFTQVYLGPLLIQDTRATAQHRNRQTKFRPLHMMYGSPLLLFFYEIADVYLCFPT